MRGSCSSGLVALLLALVLGTPLAAQSPRLQLSSFGGISLRESADGFRVGDDVIAYGVRAVLPRPGVRPWLEVSGFQRPELECVEELACNEAGVVVRGGALAVVSAAPGRPGIHPQLMAGVGAAFSEEISVSHFLGLSVAWRLGRLLSPFLEARWEHLPGLDILLMNVGLRVDVP